jgi:hypothetical protein
MSLFTSSTLYVYIAILSFKLRQSHPSLMGARAPNVAHGSALLDLSPGGQGPVAGLVGFEGGVVSGVINLESLGVRAPSRRPRHENRYHDA